MSKPARTYQDQLDLLIEPTSSLPCRLAHLLASLPPSLQPEMQIPPGWQTLPLWKPLLAAHP